MAYIDPLGLYECKADLPNSGTKNCDNFDASLEKATANLDKIKAKYGEDSDKYIQAKAAVESYGKKGEKNGVEILLDNNLPEGAGGATYVNGVRTKITPANKNGQSIYVVFSQSTFNNRNLSDSIVHEGSHIADGSEWVSCKFCPDKNPTSFQTELKAYSVEATFLQAEGREKIVHYEVYNTKGKPRAIPFFGLWNVSWKSVDEVKPQIEFFLNHAKIYRGGLNEPAFKKGVKY